MIAVRAQCRAVSVGCLFAACALASLSCSLGSSPPAKRTASNGAPYGGCEVGQACDAAIEEDGGSSLAIVGRGICTTSGQCEQSIPVPSHNHVNGPIAYPDPPPAGGDHSPCWGTWGVHDQPLGAEHWVHNLEHGGVVFLYRCPDGCAADVKQLADFVTAHRLTLLTAYDALPTRFGVVSWGHRLLSDTLDLRAFEAFYAAHVDQAPESIDSPPPSSCP